MVQMAVGDRYLYLHIGVIENLDFLPSTGRFSTRFGRATRLRRRR
jgi:hypothetical protein